MKRKHFKEYKVCGTNGIQQNKCGNYLLLEKNLLIANLKKKKRKHFKEEFNKEKLIKLLQTHLFAIII